MATVVVSIDVQGQAPEITAHGADPDATLMDREFSALPMAQQNFTEALPLIPGVVRTMNGGPPHDARKPGARTTLRREE